MDLRKLLRKEANMQICKVNLALLLCTTLRLYIIYMHIFL